MAYRTRKAPARKTRSTRRAAPARRRSTRTSYAPRRAATRTGRRASSGARTIKIVIEQAPANAVARPPIGMVEAPTPRKANF